MTIKLKESEKEALNSIRYKVIGLDFQYNSKEDQESLDTVNKAIHLHIHPSQKYREINFGCSSCIMTAVKIVRNYIVYYEVKEVIIEEVVKPDFVTLKQLRVKHPNIKATSVKSFLKKINDGK